MTAQPDVASQAAVTMHHLLQLASDAPGCSLRFNELDDARKAVTTAQAKYTARRDAFAAREQEGRRKLARLTAALTKRRDSVEQEEGMFNGAKETCAEQEREWAGLGMPKDVPAITEMDEE